MTQFRELPKVMGRVTAPSAPESPPMQERQQPSPAQSPTRPNYRKSPRRRVLKDGKLIFGSGHSILDCTIDNMSEGGAHVRVNTHGVPEEFYLVETTRAVIHRAVVAWRTTTGMGLRLVGQLEDVAAREAFLRKFRR